MPASQNFGLSETDPGLILWRDLPCDWRRPGADGPWRIFRRRGDSFGQILPRPAASDIAAFYSVDYYTHDGGRLDRAPRRTPFHWRVLSHLAWRADKGVEPVEQWWRALLGDVPVRVLDIGCGAGGALSLLRDIGHDVTGVEPDPSARSVASGKALKVYEGTAETLPDQIRPACFDVIIMSHVLEHCLEPLIAVENARRLLVPEGCLVVETPNNDCFGAAVYGPVWPWLDVPRHLNFFNADTLSELLRRGGFSIEAVEYRGYCRQFEEGWRDDQRAVARGLGLPARDEYWRFLLQFLRTVIGSRQMKYDSVRVIGRCAN